MDEEIENLRRDLDNQVEESKRLASLSLFCINNINLIEN
jgi:hypothetical protein